MDTPEDTQPVVGKKRNGTMTLREARDRCLEDLRKAEERRAAFHEDEANPGTTYHVGSQHFDCLTFALRYAHALERLGAHPKVTRDSGSVAYHNGRFYDDLST